MPVITFANPKGGSGKTTAALLLATQLAEAGTKVSIIDSDPEQWITRWSSLGTPDNVSVISLTKENAEEHIQDMIEQEMQKSSFVIIDPEGTASSVMAYAVGMSDLVVIPSQGSSMDANGAIKALGLVRRQIRHINRHIPHAVLFTRISAAVQTRSLKHITNQFEENKIPVFKTSLVERAAFRDILDYGGDLSGLKNENVSNVDKAITNAKQFTAEVVQLLKDQKDKEAA